MVKSKGLWTISSISLEERKSWFINDCNGKFVFGKVHIFSGEIGKIVNNFKHITDVFFMTLKMLVCFTMTVFKDKSNIKEVFGWICWWSIVKNMWILLVFAPHKFFFRRETMRTLVTVTSYYFKYALHLVFKKKTGWWNQGRSGYLCVKLS